MSNRCRIDVESMPNRTLREGEADSRVRSGVSVPNEHLIKVVNEFLQFSGQTGHHFDNTPRQNDFIKSFAGIFLCDWAVPHYMNFM